MRQSFSMISSLLLVGLLTFSSLAWSADLDAVLDWNHKLSLNTPISGVVQSVNVQVGDSVKKNTLLLQLDVSVYTAELEKAKAILIKQQRVHKEQQTELERNIELYEGTNLSAHELETAHIVFAGAEANLKTAQANLVRAEFNLKHSVIRAPFDAVVISRHVEAGQTVVNSQQAKTLLVVAKKETMLVKTYVSAAKINTLSAGKKVKVKLVGKQYTGTIIVLDMQSNENIPGKYGVSILIHTKGQQFRSGQPAKVQL